MRWSHN